MRLLRRSPGFAGMAVAGGCPGIGTTTAIFSVVYGVRCYGRCRIRSLNQIVALVEQVSRSTHRARFNVADFRDLREGTSVFGDIAARERAAELQPDWRGQSRSALSPLDSRPNVFSVLRVNPAIGRAVDLRR